MDFQEINPSTYQGIIPPGYDLVIAERSNIEETAEVLYGFDEMFTYESNFKDQVVGFLKL